MKYLHDMVPRCDYRSSRARACAKVCEDLVAQHDLHSNFICARTIRARAQGDA